MTLTVALLGLAHAGGASAGVIYLLAPVAAVTAPPPLAAGTTTLRTFAEHRLLGHPRTSELVRVGLDDHGQPVSVVVTQRIELNRTGDYSFVVPAPATAVRSGPGTESQPGLRDIGIVWQGFADRHRVLSATATLDAGLAAAGLPLQVRVEGRRVRLEDVAERTIPVATGRARVGAVTSVAAKLRTALARGGQAVSGRLWAVQGDPAAASRTVTVTAPLRVRGTIGGRPIDLVLGGRRPAAAFVGVPAARPVRLLLRVDLLPAAELLPGTARLAAARDPLALLQSSLAQIATSGAYRAFLASPDPYGATDASYTYRSATARPVATPAVHDGSDTLAIVLGPVIGAAALVGLAVLWARS